MCENRVNQQTSIKQKQNEINNTLMSVENNQTEFVPLWRQPAVTDGTHVSKAKKRRWIPCVIGIIYVLQVIGNAATIPYLQLTYYINLTKAPILQAIEHIGHVIGCISDVVYFAQRVQELLRELLDPLFRILSESFYDLFGASWSLICDSIGRLLHSYSNAIHSSYMFAHASALTCTCIMTACCLILGEALGLATKKHYLRPTYYIVGLANCIYRTFWDITVLHTGLLSVLKKLEHLVPYLKPFLSSCSKATRHICHAVSDTLNAPTHAFNDAVDFVATKYRQDKFAVLVSVISGVFLVAGTVLLTKQWFDSTN